MDLRFSPDEAAFRDEVRAFLRDHLPVELATKVRQGLRLTRDDMARWHAILQARGWLATHWPREWGGT
ncbi:pimeloyl-CoA dehydrogenase, large subunit [Tepidimonas thermarum]|uniref:Pimeloyl-CoA dehydrogenase, large subunit n=1 Tax=Tepidimonas thermarum TaxID=335431 RepID=A0A554WQF9_9BURK|nr:pimeloyl-CoA dehydrogenase, large subunit [Tepidimonas thermarum]